MKINPTSRKRLVLAATIAVVILLCAHPELRLFAPVVDALGVDLFAVLVGAQLWMIAAPVLRWSRDRIGLPLARPAYASGIFMLGMMGPYVDARVAARFGRGGTLLPA
jgi:hypothetical protein